MSRPPTVRPAAGPPPGLLVGAAVAIALAVLAVVLLTPWTSAPRPPVDGTAGLPPEVVADARALASRLRLPALTSLATTVVALGLLVVTRPGRSLLRTLRRRTPGRVVLPTLVVGVVVLAVEGLVRVPFAVWQERVRVAEGLSVRPPGVFAQDLATAWLLRSVPALLAVLLVVLLARRLPRWWPGVVAAIAAFFVVGASLLYPVVVEPRFASFEDLPDGPLRVEVLDVAARAGAPVRDVLVSDASTRTTTLNAYVSGLGPTRRLVLQDTLLARFDDEEVRAVVAHEAAHAAARDLVRGTVVGTAATTAAVLLLGVVAVTVGARTGRAVGGASAAGPLVLALVVVPHLATPVESLVSRQVERAADRRAVEITGDGAAYADMIRTLTVVNRSDPSPPQALQWWFGSHPTPAERTTTAERAALR
ncbi:M48 family metalloprotease [Aquipuribacter nitratireducens]|uniref:M48 family metalloprotease n=1 Tax=Aquipuribacter nitratireducens TaxID=650104 RepID=A0ABW0GVW9_9MICO